MNQKTQCDTINKYFNKKNQTGREKNPPEQIRFSPTAVIRTKSHRPARRVLCSIIKIYSSVIWFPVRHSASVQK